MSTASTSVISGEASKHDVNQPSGFRDRTASKSKRDFSGSFANKRFGTSKRKLNDYEFRKMRTKRDRIALPTNFLLGGNITDPLNLSSISTDKDGPIPLSSPQSTPSPVASLSRPLDIKIPKNFQDPLNLNASADNNQISPLSISKRSRRRKRRHSVRVSVAGEPSNHPDNAGASISRVVEASLSDSELGSMKMPNGAPPSKRSRTSSQCQTDNISPDFNPTAGLFLSPETQPSSTCSNRPSTGKSAKQPKRQDCIVSPVGLKPKFTGPSVLVDPPVGHPMEKSTFTSTVPSNKLSSSSSGPAVNKPVLPSKRGSANQARRKRRSGCRQHRTESFGSNASGPSHSAASGVPSTSQSRLDNSSKHHKQSHGKKIVRFRYGNYNRYYGKRFDATSEDPRMKTLRSVWFEGKQVLDVGCNTGTLTSLIARNYGPAKIIGIDIDTHLISVAQRNVSQFIDDSKSDMKEGDQKIAFPAALSKMYGPLAVPAVVPSISFPGNLYFKQANYVLQSDDLIALSSPKFNVILMLSITKWLQLNWGDLGVQRCFRRAFAELLPGGCLILEPQPMNTYEKRCYTPEMLSNYKAIQLKPEKFVDYLMKTVGFAFHELAGVPFHKARGFRRPIHVFWKAPVPPVEFRCSGATADVGSRKVSMCSDVGDYDYTQQALAMDQVDKSKDCGQEEVASGHGQSLSTSSTAEQKPVITGDNDDCGTIIEDCCNDVMHENEGGGLANVPADNMPGADPGLPACDLEAPSSPASVPVPDAADHLGDVIEPSSVNVNDSGEDVKISGGENTDDSCDQTGVGLGIASNAPVDGHKE